MNPSGQHRATSSATTPSRDADIQPISISVLVLVADARKSSRIFEAGQQQTFAASPEALAALPGQLHMLVRAVEDDAMRELNRFLVLLAQPEPPAAGPTTPRAAPSPAACSPQSGTPATEQVPPPPFEPPTSGEDYLIPSALPLLA